MHPVVVEIRGSVTIIALYFGGSMDDIGISSVLVATDFSDRSAAAERMAVLLATQSRAALHVVTAIEPIIGVEHGDEDAAEFADFYQKLIQRAESELQVRLAAWSEKKMVVKHHIEIGPRWRVILQTAEAQNAGLIVLGRRHYSSESPLGTTSHKVFLGSQYPVLFVPADR